MPQFYLRGFANDAARITTVRLPGGGRYTQVVKKTPGRSSTVGAATAVEKVATGLSLAKAVDVLEITGAIDAGVRERAYELGGTLAATLME